MSVNIQKIFLLNSRRFSAQQFQPLFLFTSELLDMKKLSDLYEGLELNETTYLSNAMNMTMFGTNYAFSKLREQVNYQKKDDLCDRLYPSVTTRRAMH